MLTLSLKAQFIISFVNQGYGLVYFRNNDIGLDDLLLKNFRLHWTQGVCEMNSNRNI